MDQNVAEIIKNSRIFSSLDDKAREAILPEFSECEVLHGEIIFSQGDPSTSIFLLVSGKLAAEITTATGETKIIGHIEPGECVGELGALSNEPRSLTIRALSNSTLLKLSADVFISLCHKHSSVMFETVRPMMSRSRSIIQILSSDKTNKHIILVPADENVSLENISEKIINLTSHFLQFQVISEYQPELCDPNDTHETLSAKIQTILKNKKATRILFILKSHNSLFAKIAFKNPALIYVAAFAPATPHINHYVLDKLKSLRLHLHSDPFLVLLHPAGTIAPSNTAAWLRLTDFTLHHHVRLDVITDLQRLLRFMRGKAVGLVLSGGGTRGWAHVGAIKALHEVKIPIDMIGGTSVGALVGACYSIGESYENTKEQFTKLIEASTSSITWRNLTWPIISLFNSKNFTEALKDVFDERRIEDMWLPYFCISCNLATNNEEIHPTGLTWEKTRASASIPGLVPPMLLNGELHVDGGLLNNLPVDIMRHYIGTKAKVVAIELNTYSPDPGKYDYPPILTLKEAIYARFKIGTNSYKFPSFVDTFMRGLFVGSLSKARQNALTANIFVSLNLNKFKMLYSDTKQAESLIEIGYQETLLKCMYKANKKTTLT